METEDQTLVQDFLPESLAPAPIQDEYAPVIFSQETVSHIVSIDMMSGKVCFFSFGLPYYSLSLSAFVLTFYFLATSTVPYASD